MQVLIVFFFSAGCAGGVLLPGAHDTAVVPMKLSGERNEWDISTRVMFSCFHALGGVLGAL